MNTQDFEVFKSPKFELEGLVIHRRKHLTMRGEISLKLVEHFAIVAGQDDGEDSAGRRAFKLQSPDQIVSRACEIANTLMDEFEKRGWIVEIPAYEDIPTREKTR